MPGRLWEEHLLHDHGHVDLPVVEAAPQPIGHGPLGEQGGPASADVLEDRSQPHNVQVRVLLAREGCRRQVLRRRAGSDGVGSLPAKPGDRAGDRRRQVVRDGDPPKGLADLRTERADRLPVAGVQARQPIQLIVDPGHRCHDPPEGVRGHAEAGRHTDAFDPRKLPQVRTLAAHERDLRLVDLFETQHIALDHRDTSRVAALRCTAMAGRARRHDRLCRTSRLARPHLVPSCPARVIRRQQHTHLRITHSINSEPGLRLCGTTGVLRQAPRCAID